MGHYRDLRAWQVAHELAMEVHDVVSGFPRHERFELSSQLKRAVLSVPANLAEGQGRYGAREALRFSRIATGSLIEVDYLLFYAFKRGYMDAATHKRLEAKRQHASRVTAKLISSLRSKT